MTNRVHGFVEGREDSEPMKIQLVSGTYFPMLGVEAMTGRALSEEDDRTEGGHPVAVVSYAWWSRNFARDPSVLDKKLTIGSTVFSIVGVAPREFFGTKVGEAPDIWIPLSMQKEVPPGFNGYNDDHVRVAALDGAIEARRYLAGSHRQCQLLFQESCEDSSGFR